jgi:caffeoyl-CoA O-methyltransferase
VDITDPRIERYATEHSSQEPPHLIALAEQTRERFRMHRMMVGPLEGRFLAALVAISGARHVLEIGTFTGYSALSMAEALPDDGTIVTCEVDERHAAVAREAIGASPYADRIEIRLGPALDTIATLDGPFDLVFIDADKPGYPAYLDAVLPLLAERGVVVADNVLRGGDVLDPARADEGTRAIIAFNERVALDPSLACVMLPIRDGVSLIRKVPVAA